MTDTAAGKTRTTTLDAFGYWPRSASRISGLGGQVVDPDFTYAFHSNYAEVGAGVVRVTLKFAYLEATMGTITFRVNGLPPGPGARAETVRTWTASLREMADGEGVAELSFQASEGTRYAVLGQIYVETDARASGLEITLITDLENRSKEQRAATRKSIFGRRVFRRANRMFLPDAATLADPVSQACTPAQFDEPGYARWTAEMKVPPLRDRTQWERVFVLQTLWRYGMLRPGARGLGFAVGAEPLPAVMASHGCSVLATDDPAADPAATGRPAVADAARAIEALRFEDICADEVFDRQVSFRVADLNTIPKDLAGFDFLWSHSALEHLGSIEAGLKFVRGSVECLTFGGLAVHTTDFNIGSVDTTVDQGGTVLFRKPDLEKIAVDLVSRGHYVAQFKYDLGGPRDRRSDPPNDPASAQLRPVIEGYPATSFGLIVRRGER